MQKAWVLPVNFQDKQTNRNEKIPWWRNKYVRRKTYWSCIWQFLYIKKKHFSLTAWPFILYTQKIFFTVRFEHISFKKVVSTLKNICLSIWAFCSTTCHQKHFLSDECHCNPSWQLIHLHSWRAKSNSVIILFIVSERVWVLRVFFVLLSHHNTSIWEACRWLPPSAWKSPKKASQICQICLISFLFKSEMLQPSQIGSDFMIDSNVFLSFLRLQAVLLKHAVRCVLPLTLSCFVLKHDSQIYTGRAQMQLMHKWMLAVLYFLLCSNSTSRAAHAVSQAVKLN